MKIAALIPFSHDPEKPDFGSVECAASATDVVIVMCDNCSRDRIKARSLTTEILEFNNRLPWNDWHNRLTLLSRAAAHSCDWVLWLDMDETLHPNCRSGLREICMAADARREVAVVTRILEMWNSSQFRVDGLWGKKTRIGLQRNPLMSTHISWAHEPGTRFHRFPHQEGEFLHDSGLDTLHWGMSSPKLRTLRCEKWKRLDPEKKLQWLGYDYMLDETGLTLETVA